VDPQLAITANGICDPLGRLRLFRQFNHDALSRAQLPLRQELFDQFLDPAHQPSRPGQ
jgi:hypothetical protein